MITEESVNATRRATPADVPALVHVINRAYAVEEFFVNGPRVDDAGVRARIAKPNGLFLAIDDGEPARLAGCVYVELRGERGYFGLLSVDPDRQKRGYGRVLVNAVETVCRSAGCRYLDLDTVDLRVELPAFYAGLGFTQVGVAEFPEEEKLKVPAALIVWSKEL